MANEKVNKVVLGNETLIDLTSDTVNENNLLAGETAHDASGEQIRGAVTVPTELDDLSDVDAGSPSNGDVLFNDGSDWINKNIHPEVTYAEYKAMEQAGTLDPDVEYFISDMNVANVPIDDATTSASKVYSSQKTQNELNKKLSYADNGILGAKNLLPNNATSQTINDIAFTVNSDGSITCNGTASADAILYFYVGLDAILPNGQYTISGAPNGGGIGNYWLGIENKTADNWATVYADGTPYTFTKDNGANNWYKAYVQIYSGYVANNLTFYPMIRLASDTDPTYQPYAKTNRELTNAHKTTTKEVAITGWTSDTTSQSGTTLYKKTISLSHVYVDSPSVDIGASGVLPTSAQQEAYDLLQYVTIDGTTLTLYASDIPTTAFYIKITGVD